MYYAVMSEEEKAVKHFGVLGMKWGRRSGGKNSSVKSFKSQKVSSLDREKVKKGALIAAGVVASIGAVSLAYHVGHSSAVKKFVSGVSANSRKVGKAAVAARKLGNKSLPSSMNILDISFEDAMRYTGRLY